MEERGAVVRVQPVQLPDGERTWTVLGVDQLPVPVAESYLELLRQTGRSPNTVKSYARALQLWWSFLQLRNRDWDGVRLEDFTGFLGWLRSGLPPDVEPIYAVSRLLSDATVAVRLQAVRFFYRYQQDCGVDVAPWLFTTSTRTASRYKPFLKHLRRGRLHTVSTVRVARRRSVAPTLTPRQITAIKDHCGHYDPQQRQWVGSVRDRLLFSLLEETGLRLGEALALQNRDWHSGRGENPYLEVVPRAHPHGLRVKGGNYRKLYMSDTLDRLYAEHLWQLCDAGMDMAVPDMDSAYLFVNQHGGQRFAPLRPETVYKLVGRLRSDLAGQTPPDWTPHWFRHTHATALLLSGRPVHVVSRRLGHRDVQTTLDTYAWVTDDEQLRSLADWASVTATWSADRETT